MCLLGDWWKEDFQKCLLPGTSRERDSSRRHDRWKSWKTLESTRLPRTKKRKKKKEKKEKRRSRGLDSTDELCERMYIQSKLTASWRAELLRRNNHRLPVIIAWKGKGRIDVSFLEIKKHRRGRRNVRSRWRAIRQRIRGRRSLLKLRLPSWHPPLFFCLFLSLSRLTFSCGNLWVGQRGLSTWRA